MLHGLVSSGYSLAFCVHRAFEEEPVDVINQLPSMSSPLSDLGAEENTKTFALQFRTFAVFLPLLKHEISSIQTYAGPSTLQLKVNSPRPCRPLQALDMLLTLILQDRNYS
jgi:hypothetical protein